MEMRKSRIKRKINEEGIAFSLKLNFNDPRGVELGAMCGFDAIWVDMEHVPSTFVEIENMVRAAKLYDTDIITRVAKGCYSDYIRPLEADSTGIMVPHLMNFEEAQKIVYYTKFHPIGRRPLDGGNADGAYCLIEPQNYMKTANEERITIVQIEDPEPMGDLEKICALPGIDMIFFGPADFSQGIAAPCEFSNPQLLDARKRVAECARKHNKFAGTTGGVGNYKELWSEGYNFINLTSDVIVLGNTYRDIIKTVKSKEEII